MRPPLGIVLLLLISAAPTARAAGMLVPSAKAVIYPGDLITEEALADAPFAGPVVGGPIALTHEEIVGKMARRTLLPGRAIALAAVDNPRVVRNGGEVTMIYIDGGLTITTTGAAMQDAGIGDLIKVRNVDSGVTVQGRVRADGSVLVNGG